MSEGGINRRHLLTTMAGTTAWTYCNAKTLNAGPVVSWESELIPNSQTEHGSDPDSSADSPTSQPPIRILLNENPLGCSPKARAAAIDAVTRAQYYPFDLATKLANQLRHRHGMAMVPEPVGLSSRVMPSEDSHILSLAGGSSELLFAMAHAFTSEGGSIVEADPSYQALGAFAMKRPNTNAYIKRVPLLPNGEADLEGMFRAIDHETKVVVINNPNNPTGAASGHNELIDFLKRIPERVIAVVDEAYIDFLDDSESRSVIPLALQSSNLLVTRTFSKIHGLAGLRVGYAVGPRQLLERMQNYRVGPFSLNQCGIAAASASIEDLEFQNLSRQVARQSRVQITECLTENGFKVARSDAACVWAEGKSDVSPLVQQLAQRGILIASGLRWNRPNCLRISIATPEQTTKLVHALKEIFEA